MPFFFFSQLFKPVLKPQLGTAMSRPDAIFNIAGRCYDAALAGRLAARYHKPRYLKVSTRL